MKKSQLNKIIRSALQEIKVKPSLSPTELFKEISSELTPFYVYHLLISENVDDFLNSWIDNSDNLEAGFEDQFELNLNSYRPKLETLNRLAEQKEIEPLFMAGEGIEIGDFQYNISGYSYLTTIEDGDYNYVYVSKFPLT
jgi:hypothetical protein